MDNRNLIEAAIQLRGAAPQEWDRFVHAMREYAAGITADIIRVDAQMLVRAQGMAIQAQEIAVILRDAPDLHDKNMQAILRQAQQRSNNVTNSIR